MKKYTLASGLVFHAQRVKHFAYFTFSEFICCFNLEYLNSISCSDDQKVLEDRLDKLVQENQDSSASVTNDVTSAHGRRLKKKCLDKPFLEVHSDNRPHLTQVRRKRLNRAKTLVIFSWTSCVRLPTLSVHICRLYRRTIVKQHRAAYLLSLIR